MSLEDEVRKEVARLAAQERFDRSRRNKQIANDIFEVGGNLALKYFFYRYIVLPVVCFVIVLVVAFVLAAINDTGPLCPAGQHVVSDAHGNGWCAK